MNPSRLLPLLLGLLLAAPALAEREQALYISADRVEIDDAKGVSSYLGRVELRQGSVTLQAARISFFRQGETLSRLEASGKPVRFTQGEGEGQTRAEASALLYDLQKGEVRLTGGVHLWQGGNEFSGEQIRYDIDKRLVKAERGTSDDGRIHAIIRPGGALPGVPGAKPAEEKKP